MYYHSQFPVPTTDVIFEENLAFVQSDPFDGRWDGGEDVLKSDRWTPWDELYLSPWIEIPDPLAAGASGGVPLKHFSEDPAWSSSSQGFVPSILHQLHCVVSSSFWKIHNVSVADLTDQ